MKRCAALLVLAIACGRPPAPPDRPSVGYEGLDFDAAVEQDRITKTDCGDERFLFCHGPAGVIAMMQAGADLKEFTPIADDLHLIASTGSAVITATARSGSDPYANRVAAMLGEPAGCKFMATQVRDRSPESLPRQLEQLDLCPGIASVPLMSALRRRLDRATTLEPPWRKQWVEHGYALDAVSRAASRAAEYGLTQARPLVREAVANGLGLDFRDAPMGGEFPAGDPSLDVALMRLGDVAHRQRVRAWLIANNDQIADIEPLADGLGYEADDADVLLRLAERYRTAGPARALVRYLMRHGDGDGGRKVAAALDGLAGGDDERRVNIETARLIAGRPGAADVLFGLATRESRRHSTWAALTMLLQHRDLLTPAQRETAYDLALDHYVDTLASTPGHIAKQRTRVLDLLAEAGGARDGRWAIGLFDIAHDRRTLVLFGRHRPTACSVLLDVPVTEDGGYEAQPEPELGPNPSGISDTILPPAFAYASLPRGTCTAEAKELLTRDDLPDWLRILGLVILTLRQEQPKRAFRRFYGRRPDPRNRSAREIANMNYWAASRAPAEPR